MQFVQPKEYMSELILPNFILLYFDGRKKNEFQLAAKISPSDIPFSQVGVMRTGWRNDT